MKLKQIYFKNNCLKCFNVVAVVQLLNRFWLFMNARTAAHQASALHCLLEFAQVRVHWVGDAIWPSHPLPPSSAFVFSFSNIMKTINVTDPRSSTKPKHNQYGGNKWNIKDNTSSHNIIKFFEICDQQEFLSTAKGQRQQQMDQTPSEYNGDTSWPPLLSISIPPVSGPHVSRGIIMLWLCHLCWAHKLMDH